MRTEQLNNKYPENMQPLRLSLPVSVQLAQSAGGTADINIGIGELQECTISK